MVGVHNPRQVRLAVTRLSSDYALPDKTAPFPREAFFTVQVYLRPTSGARLWHGNRELAVDPNRYEGSVTTHDFEQRPSVYLGSPFDILQFYVSRDAMDEFTDQNELHRCRQLSWPHGKVDLSFKQIALTVLPAFEAPSESSQFHVDYLILAAHAYIVRTYGGVSDASIAARGGLAPWQERRATELLREHLDGSISLVEVARQCGLSPSHFAHAFKRTFGLPPHRWLIEHRLRLAKELLLATNLPIVEIAHSSGFSDQTAFHRAFKRQTKMSANAWRRNRGVG